MEVPIHTFLPGVYPRCMQDILEPPKKTHRNIKTIVPTYMDEMIKWPKKTTVMCWRCSEDILDIPYPFPISIMSSEITQYAFKTKGFYCSPICVAYQILDAVSDPTNRSKYIKMLYGVCIKIYRYKKSIKERCGGNPYDNCFHDTSQIPEFPYTKEHIGDHFSLVKYGGDITKDAHRQKIDRFTMHVFDIIETSLQRLYS
jgi:hypothetical protein